MLYFIAKNDYEVFRRQGKWVKGKCEQKYKFVCKLDQSNFVRECDEGFEKIQGDNDYCYKYEARCYK